MNALVALGSFAAWAYSVVATFAPRSFRRARPMSISKPAGVIVTLILLGRLLEARAKGRAGAAIQALSGLSPRPRT